MKLVKIGQAAKLTGLTVEALRYYEKRGLISPQQKLSSGYRLYSSDITEQVAFIQRCKSIGFSLQETLELIQLQQTPNATAAEVKRRIDQKLGLIDEKLTELQFLKQSLSELSMKCSGKGEIDQCPIILELNQTTS